MGNSMKCIRCGGSGKEPDHKALGQAMRAKREASGLTLRSLAKRLSFSAAYISDLELGRRNWSAGMRESYLDQLK